MCWAFGVAIFGLFREFHGVPFGGGGSLGELFMFDTLAHYITPSGDIQSHPYIHLRRNFLAQSVGVSDQPIPIKDIQCQHICFYDTVPELWSFLSLSFDTYDMSKPIPIKAIQCQICFFHTQPKLWSVLSVSFSSRACHRVRDTPGVPTMNLTLENRMKV